MDVFGLWEGRLLFTHRVRWARKKRKENKNMEKEAFVIIQIYIGAEIIG